MTSKALGAEFKTAELLPLTDWFTAQMRADFKSRSLTGNQTVAIQTACNEVAAAGGGYDFTVGDGVARTTSPIVMAAPMAISGRSVSPYTAAIGTRGGGSWFYIDHTGVGFDIDGAAIMGGTRISGIGTFRSQPTPGGGWAPTAHDFDFDVDNADVTFDDVTLLNPTKGIRLANGNAGRLVLRGLRGQPLQVGVQCDSSFDQVIASDCRFWAYWKDDSNVHAYTLQNLDAWWFKHCDGPQLSNIFTIFARAGLRFSEVAAGRPNSMQASNIYVDSCKTGLWVDNTVTTGGVLGQFSNLIVQGHTGLAGSIGMLIEGANNVALFNGPDLRNLGLQGISVTGGGNQFRISDLEIDPYNVDAAGAEAIEIAATSQIILSTPPRIGTGTGFSGAGDLVGPLGDNLVNATTDGSGDITVTHGSKITPVKVYAQTKGTTYTVCQPHTYGASTFKVRVFDAAGAAIAATAFDLQYEMFA